jgi:hypothetical protein
MAIDAWDDLAIFRCCMGCEQWLPLTQFPKNHGWGRPSHVCRECQHPRKSTPVRTLVVTEKGKRFLRDMESDAA